MEIRGPTERLKQIADALDEACKMDAEITTRCGQAGIAMMVHRTTVLHLDADGNQFKDYSEKPAYIYDQTGSTVATAAGRKLRRGGGAILKQGKKGRALVAGAGGTAAAEYQRARLHLPVTRLVSTSTHYFPGGYAQFKPAIGHNGVDLMVSGKMLGGMGQPATIGVQHAGPRSVTIALIDQTQLGKAEGNNAIREFWGVGRIASEIERLARIASRAVAEKVRRAIHGIGATPEEVMKAIMGEDGLEVKE